MQVTVGFSLRSLVLLSLIVSLASLASFPLAAERTAAAPASILSARWARGVPEGIGESSFASLARDGVGNTYAAGYMQDETLELGDGVSVVGRSGVNFNPLLVKYSTTGTVLWARSATAGEGVADFYSVAVDSAGNAYAVGTMQGHSIGFSDRVRVENRLQHNALIVKFDAKGTALWARSLVSSGSELDGSADFSDVAVDSRGNVYAIGAFVNSGDGEFDLSDKAPGYFRQPSVLGSSGSLFIKYDPSGKALWVDAPDCGGFTSLTLDASDNVYVVGGLSMGEGVAFGGKLWLKAPAPAILATIVKYSPAGKALWAACPVSAAHNSDYRSVSVDEKGNIYAFGSINGQGLYDLGNGVALRGSSPKNNPLIARYDGQGKAQWARSVVRGAGDFSFAGGAVNEGFLYLAGSLGSENGGEIYDFGLGPTDELDKRIVGPRSFLAAYTVTGTPAWLDFPLTVQGLSQARIFNICSAGSDGLIIAGQIFSNMKAAVDFGNGLSVDSVGGSRSSLFVAGYKLLPVTPSGQSSPTTPGAKAQELATGQGPASSLSAISNDNRVRVRAAPNLQAATLGYLNKGDALSVLEKSLKKMRIDTMEDYWYRVRRLSDGLEGWSFGQYLSLGE